MKRAQYDILDLSDEEIRKLDRELKAARRRYNRRLEQALEADKKRRQLRLDEITSPEDRR